MNRRHIRVVSCVPVPNAWPGSTVSTTSRSSFGYSSQEGLMTSLRPILRARKCSFHFSAQPESVISAAPWNASGPSPNDSRITGRNSRKLRFSSQRSVSQGK